MIKKVLTSLCILSSFYSFSQQGDKINGIWLTEEKTSQVQIYRAVDGKYYGKVIWLSAEKRNKIDDKNPNEKLRSRPVLGILIVSGLKYNAETKEWEGGTIYDPKNGSSYDSFGWFENDNYETLHLKGFVMGMRFIGRTTTWIREKEKRKE
jgi:uncharacterized protein (DUF2147 family)